MPHKYIARIRTKSGKWRYVYENKSGGKAESPWYGAQRKQLSVDNPFSKHKSKERTGYSWSRHGGNLHGAEYHQNMNTLSGRDRNPNYGKKKGNDTYRMVGKVKSYMPYQHLRKTRLEEKLKKTHSWSSRISRATGKVVGKLFGKK